MRIENKIKTLRIQKGLTLKELSQLTGLSPSHLSRIERGLRHPSLRTAWLLSRAFNVDVSELFIHKSKISTSKRKSKEEKSKNLHRRFKGWIFTIISKLL